MKLLYILPALTLFWLVPLCLQAQPATPVPRGIPGDLWADVILGHADPDPVHHPNYAFGDIVGNQAGPRAIDKADSAVVDKIP